MEHDTYIGNAQIPYATLAISLPYELFQDIFHLTYPQKTIHDAPQAPDFLVCGQVCSHWRRALIADTYVWSRISLPNYAPDLVHQCLSYSKNRPLEVYIGSPMFYPALEDVLDQMYRIRSLFWIIRPRESYCRYYLFRPAPCLEILCMGPFVRQEYGYNSSILYQRQPPKIKHLHLRATSILPFECVFHSLIHLNLQNPPDFPPFSKLFDILELTPNLQELLFQCNNNTKPLDDIPEDRSVKVPSLSRIELRAPSSVVLLLIHHIIISEGTKWFFKCPDVNIISDETFLSFLSSHSVGRTGLRCLVIGNKLYINLDEYDDDGTDSRNKKIGQLQLEINFHDVISSLRRLFYSEALLRATSLELDCANSLFIETFYRGILWCFPDVWHMTLNVSVQFLSAQTISCFSDVMATESNGSLPCPSLTHLVVCARISTTTSFEALVSCLRRRHARSPLRSLQIVDDTFKISEEDMGKIRQYVPDVHIVRKRELY